jgi:hypothetical protein
LLAFIPLSHFNGDCVAKTIAFALSVIGVLLITTPPLMQSAPLYTRASSAVTEIKAFKSRSNSISQAAAPFTIAGTAKVVTRYADGNLSYSCTRGTYSIANRDCTGSDGDAHISLQAASNASEPGDTILIRSFSGTYRGSGESNLISARAGTSPSNRTLYQGYGRERPVVTGFDGQDNRDYIHIKNLIIDGNNEVDSLGIFGGRWLRIENVEIKNCGRHGILGPENSEFINLNVHHNGHNTADRNSPGTHGLYAAIGLLIDGGRYHNNRSYGIHCYPNCTNTTIRNLRVDHNGAAGIIISTGPGNVIYNVISDNNNGWGIAINSPNAVAYNLTLYNNHASDMEIGSGGSNVTVRDSIILGGIEGINSKSAALSNNITSGSASSLFMDVAKGNFQLRPMSRLKGIGADLSSAKY